HHYGVSVIQVFYHVFGHDVIEGIIIKWKAPRRIEVDYVSINREQVGVEPAGQEGIICAQMQLLWLITLEICIYLPFTRDSPDDHAHVNKCAAKSLPDTNNKLRALENAPVHT